MSTEKERHTKYLQCDKNKFNQLKSYCWCEAENPYLIVPCEFTIPGSNNFVSGILMITFGAHYLFKNKVFGGLEFVMEFNILKISLLQITKSKLIFDFSDCTIDGTDPTIGTHLSSNGISPKKKNSKEVLKSAIVIKSDKVEQIAYVTTYILRTVAWNLNGIQLMRINSDINFEQVDFPKRPDYALRHRVIFLAHYYENKGPNLDEAIGFTKWETLHSGLIFIGKTFDPGSYTLAFAHALAWEAEIKSIVFKGFISPSFPLFFDCLMTNSHYGSVTDLLFQGYQPDAIIDFSGHAITNQNCSIKNISFSRVPGQLIINFLTKCTRIPCIECLAIQSIKFEQHELIAVCQRASENEVLCSTIRRFDLSRCKLSKCPLRHISSMLNHFRYLSMIVIRDFIGDGLRFIQMIADAKIPVRIIRLNLLKFRGSFENITYPDSLRILDVSFCEFTDVAISSFLISLTNRPMKEPIILQMRKLHLKKNCYPAISRINFDHCYPNIAEFDFSYNRIPAFAVRSLFAFLFTQKNLRLLSLEHVATTAPVQFLKNIMVLLLSLQLPGFDFSSALKDDLQYLQKGKKGKRTSTESADSITSQQGNEDEENSPNSLVFIDSHNENHSNFTAIVDSLIPNDSAACEPKPDEKVNPADLTKIILSSRLEQFIQALVQQNYTSFRRLCLPSARFEQEGINALIRLIEISPNLNEVDFRRLKFPNQEEFFRFWKVVASKSSIVASNYPEETIAELNINLLEQSTENQNIMQKILNLPRPSTAKKRTACSLSTPSYKPNPQQLVCRDDNIFFRSASFDYVELEKPYIEQFLMFQLKKTKKIKTKTKKSHGQKEQSKPEGDFANDNDDDNDDDEFEFEDDEIEQTPNNNEIQVYDKNDKNQKGYDFGVQFIDNLLD